MNKQPVEERILTGLFLSSSSTNELLQLVKPEWNGQIGLSINEKLQLLHLEAKDLFPLVEALSSEIDANAFCKSHFTQPDLFLRIRPGFKDIVLNKLTDSGIPFQVKELDVVAVPNHSKLDDVILVNKEAVVQDLSSQRVASLLDLVRKEWTSDGSVQGRVIRVWDCCAASGGKSIMAKDILGEIDLTVSDIRESILVNLKKRFAEAGIHHYKSFVADLSKASLTTPQSSYDLIIADVPCSGSGTWGRTPEYVTNFHQQQLDGYSQLQRRIASNVLTQLRTGGYLLYITCSVYKQENEEVVHYLQQQHALEFVQMNILRGYEEKADTMFAALLIKS